MNFGSAGELYLTLLGWHIHNGLWAILLSTGALIIPFIAVLLRRMIDAATDNDEMRSVDVPIYVMMAVLMIANLPTVEMQHHQAVNTSFVCINNQSGGFERKQVDAKFGQTGTTYDDTTSVIAGFSGTTAKAPLWWYFFHKFSQAATLSLNHYLPCQPDLRGLITEFEYMRISDIALQDEADQFVQECWKPALNNFFRDKPSTQSYTNIEDDIDWAGSDFLLKHYYPNMLAKDPVKNFPISASSQDYNPNNPAVQAENKGTPKCNEWWEDKNHGLRERLLADVNPTSTALLTQKELTGRGMFTNIPFLKSLFSATDDEAENIVLKAALQGNQSTMNFRSFNSYTTEMQEGSMTDYLSKVFSSAGMVYKTASASAESYVYQQAAPIVQAMVIMMFIAVLPLLSLISGYKLETLITMSIAFASIIFWTFLFSLAYWIDNFLLEGLASAGVNQGNFFSLKMLAGQYATELDVITWISRFTYIFLPLIFTGLLSMAGHAAGSSVGGMVRNMGQGVAGAGKGGTGLVGKMPVRK